MALQCDTSAPVYDCGVNMIIDAQSEFSACGEEYVIYGQVLPGIPVSGNKMQVLSNEDELFGVGSMAASMVKAARCQASFSDIRVVPLPDFGTKGQSVVTFSDAASLTQSEIVYLVVHGEIYSVTVSPGDTDAMIAAAMALVIDDARVTVTASGADLTIETVNGGEIGGALDVRSEYLIQNIMQPASIGVAINTTQGVGVPSGFIPLLAESAGTFIAFPYSDVVSQNAMRDYICSTWSPREEVMSEGYTVISGDVTAGQSLVSSLNSEQMHPAYFSGMLNPSYDATAAYAMAAYQGLNSCNDPLSISQGLRGIELKCLKASEAADRIGASDADTLIGEGLSLIAVNSNGRPYIRNYTTSYRTDRNGVRDEKYLRGQHVAQMRNITGFLRSNVHSFLYGKSLRADGYIPKAGEKIVTPAFILSRVQELGIELSKMNLIEDADQFAQSAMVEWGGGNSCVNIAAFPNLVNETCCTNIFVTSSI